MQSKLLGIAMLWSRIRKQQ